MRRPLQRRFLRRQAIPALIRLNHRSGMLSCPRFLRRPGRGGLSYCFSDRRQRSSNRLFRLFGHRFLTHLGGQANLLVEFNIRIFFFYLFHNIVDIPLGHRRLVRDNQFLRFNVQPFHIFFGFNKMNDIRGDADRSFRLRVSFFRCR